MMIFYPEDRTGYETKEQMIAQHDKVKQAAIKSYPGASSDEQAILMALCNYQSIVTGAKLRLTFIENKLVDFCKGLEKEQQKILYDIIFMTWNFGVTK